MEGLFHLYDAGVYYWVLKNRQAIEGFSDLSREINGYLAVIWLLESGATGKMMQYNFFKRSYEGVRYRILGGHLHRKFHTFKA